MDEAVAILPSGGSPETTAVGKLHGVGELMLDIPGSADPEGEVRELLQLGVEAGVRKGHAESSGREEAFRRAEGGRKVGVARHEHQRVARAQVEKLHGRHSEGDVGLFLFVTLDPFPAVGAGGALSLEGGHVEVDIARLKGLQVCFMPMHSDGITPLAERRDRGEKVDLFQGSPLPEHTAVGTQKPSEVRPAETGGPHSDFGLENGEVQVETVNVDEGLHGKVQIKQEPPEGGS